MTVGELITELQKCDPNDIVVYDFENALLNSEDELIKEFMNQHQHDFIDSVGGVDDVLIGKGTLRGMVYLSEDEYE